MKHCIPYFVISLFLFSPSPLFAEVDLFKKAVAEYVDESYEEALEILIEAKENQPESSSVAFYLGLTF